MSKNIQDILKELNYGDFAGADDETRIVKRARDILDNVYSVFDEDGKPLVSNKIKGVHVVIWNPKGGVAKSETTIQVGVPYRYLVIDVDQTGATADRINKGILELKGDKDIGRYHSATYLKDDQNFSLKHPALKKVNIWIDTPGTTHKRSLELVKEADVVIVPLQPSKTDIVTTMTFMSKVLPSISTDVKFIFQFSRVKNKSYHKRWVTKGIELINKLVENHTFEFHIMRDNDVMNEMNSEDQLIREHAHPNGYDKPSVVAYKFHVEMTDILHEKIQRLGGGC